MALFGGNKQRLTKEEKQVRERQVMMEKLGMLELDEKDMETVQQIMIDLAGTGGLLGQVSSITFSNADMQKVNAAWAQVRQNWIIIRQLNKLNRNIELLINSRS